MSGHATAERAIVCPADLTARLCEGAEVRFQVALGAVFAEDDTLCEIDLWNGATIEVFAPEPGLVTHRFTAVFEGAPLLRYAPLSSHDPRVVSRRATRAAQATEAATTERVRRAAQKKVAAVIKPSLRSDDRSLSLAPLIAACADEADPVRAEARCVAEACIDAWPAPPGLAFHLVTLCDIGPAAHRWFAMRVVGGAVTSVEAPPTHDAPGHTRVVARVRGSGCAAVSFQRADARTLTLGSDDGSSARFCWVSTDLGGRFLDAFIARFESLAPPRP
jgi:hypothetical protein